MTVEMIEHDPFSATCACPGCGGVNIDVDNASVDPQAGGTLNGKPILSADQVAAHLNRSGSAYTSKPTDAKQQGDTDVSVISYGFFATQGEMANNGYVYQSPADGKFYGLAEYFNFAPFSDAQKLAAREAMDSWDDVVAVTFRETHINDADITFGNLASAPTTQAYSRLPFDRIFTNSAVNEQSKWIAGDVWISASQASNFRLDEGMYGIHTLVHEVGHSLGLSHPGAYNAAPGVSITYPVNAEYAQDTRAYSVMSYFEASSISGTRHFDFNVSTTVYSATPLVHDIAAVQRIYGADMTTRTGDTVYGFNSNAGRDSYDFNKTPAPVMAIWDAGGIDTIDASGYATDQIIDLAPGSLSSIGGVTFETAPSLAQVNANRAAQNLPPVAQATYDANMAALKANPAVGRLTNNVGIAYGATIENAIGGSGNDSLLGNSVDNLLEGNGGNDIIGGGAGNDTLDGGAGLDQLIGGIGNDLYVVDNAGDIVTEKDGEGTDTVRSSISYTLGDNLENLILVGEEDETQRFNSFAMAAAVAAATLTGTGNALANQISAVGAGDFILKGEGGNDVLIGGFGNDLLDGGEGNDSMTGGAGNDHFTGGAGDDIFEGGAGDDIYLIDDLGDVVVEHAGGGTDTVKINVDGYKLAGGVEKAELGKNVGTVSGNDSANFIVGNDAANVIDGGAGDDRLAGGKGVDRLTGGEGRDTFVAQASADDVVATKRGMLSLDIITDFSLADDFIDFTGIDARSDVDGHQAFTFVGKADPKAGEIGYKTFGNINAAESALGYELDGIDGLGKAGPVTVIYGNTDGDKDAEFAIVLLGTHDVTVQDFLL